MLLTRIALTDVRNYASLEFLPSAGLNVLVGENAQGKSNLLEAISLLGTGKSFRTSKEGDLVRAGSERAIISGDASVRAGSVRLSCSITATSRAVRKTYAVNGRNVRYARFLGSLHVVAFVPADLQLVGGPPSGRRAFLNVALAQHEPAYYRALATYQKALQQKGALLRSPEEPDPQLLAIYNAALIEAGTQIVLARRAFVVALAGAARRVHAQWTGGRETFLAAYRPNVAFEVPTADAVAQALTSRLREVEPAERARKAPLAGPHRDDLELTLDGVSLAAYGSQGQQRTAVLALKVAEYTVMRERCGEAPLLLLDDVLSELDEARARAFIDGVGTYEQAFITATHVPAGIAHGRFCEVVRGTLRERSTASYERVS